ncbi:MAG: peptide chain release factor N(5)-glutamine methyltransferase [bacterium]
MEKKNWTIIDVLKWTSGYFTEKGIESARLNIELILCSVLNISRIDIYTKHDKPLNDLELKNIRNMVLKRVSGEPLQYVLGKTTFLDTEIMVNDTVMIPRPETELLVNCVLNDYPNKYKKIKILDIGTGSGCIALNLAKNFQQSDVLAIDSSYFALLTAKNNGTNLAIRNISFNQCDILKEIPTNEKFDIIVSNPPYIPLDEYNQLDDEIKNHEPKEALTDGSDGLTYYRRFSRIFPELLKKEGRFYCEMGYNQRQHIENIFSGQVVTLTFFNDFNNIPRVVRGCH